MFRFVIIFIIVPIIYAIVREYIRRHRVSGDIHEGTATKYEAARLLYVIDGDTLFVKLQNGLCEKIRVIGIDAPESACHDDSLNSIAGQQATEFARHLTANSNIIWLERDVENRDKYNRLLRHVWLRNPENDNSSYCDDSFSCLMVRSGHAKPMYVSPNGNHHLEIMRAYVWS